MKAIKKINHKQIIKLVCEETNGSEKEAQKYIDSYINVIMEQTCQGNNVGIKKLGTMKIEEAAEKSAYDFQKKANVMRPSRTLPKMSFNREFSNRIKVLGN